MKTILVTDSETGAQTSIPIGCGSDSPVILTCDGDAWSGINTTTDLAALFTDNELTLIQQYTTADKTTDIVRNAIAEVRGRLAACKKNTLNVGETVPREVRSHVLAVIRFRMINSIPVKTSMLTASREAEYKEAVERVFPALSRGELLPSPPDVPVPQEKQQQPDGGARVVSQRRGPDPRRRNYSGF